MKAQQRLYKQRRRRRLRNRNAVKRNSTRPRLSVFRSHKHMYAQIIDDGDEKGSRTLVAASTVGQESYGGNCEAARQVGKTLAERALEAGIQKVAFDRREYKYHGRVAALADAARDAGLDLGPKKVVPEKLEPKAKAKSKKSKSQAKK